MLQRHQTHAKKSRVAHALMACCVLILVLIEARATGAGHPPVDFARDVRPILSDACFRCHGPDEAHQEGKGLRLDTVEGLFRTRKAITVVKPGAPDESELILRTESTDKDEVMPPDDAVRKLTPAEISRIRTGSGRSMVAQAPARVRATGQTGAEVQAVTDRLEMR